jgi:hypothetical protein
MLLAVGFKTLWVDYGSSTPDSFGKIRRNVDLNPCVILVVNGPAAFFALIL